MEVFGKYAINEIIPVDGNSISEKRSLGLTVIKGSLVNMVSPASQIEEIPNPFQHVE